MALLFSFFLIRPHFFLCFHFVTHAYGLCCNGTIGLEAVCHLLDVSFNVTASKKKKQELRPPKEWLIPSNPKYFDIIHAFDNTDAIDRKQGAGIKKGDTIFMYVGVPVSAILYKCKVTETDIFYDFHTEGLTIKKLMKIRLQKKYKPDIFTFDRLKSKYGIFAVRGARSVPNSLSVSLKEK